MTVAATKDHHVIPNFRVPKLDNMTSTAYPVLHSLLNDNELHDVTLQGNDGVSVSACRNVLAVKSRVFRSMFYRDFAESNSSDVKIDFPGKVMRIFLHACHMDNVDPLEEEGQQYIYDGREFSTLAMQTAITLLEACDFFELDLQVKINETILSWMENRPFLALVALDQIFRGHNGAAFSIKLKMNAEKVVRRYMSSMVDVPMPEEMGIIHPEVVANILRDSALPASEYSLFLFLRGWFEIERSGIIRASNGEEKTRLETAVSLASLINLEKIRPSLLGGPVASSGLVPPSKLNEVYKAQALLAESLDTRRFVQQRSPHLWKMAGLNVAAIQENEHDYIDCPLMVSGKHEWSFEVVRVSERMRVGVIAFKKSGMVRKALALKNRGKLFENPSKTVHEMELPTFESGSTLWFRLRIENEGRVVLSMSVDQKNFQTIERDAFFKPEKRDGISPYAKCSEGTGHIRFLGFSDSLE